jgi:myo-inositol-1(or 4)-monophosphatase
LIDRNSLLDLAVRAARAAGDYAHQMHKRDLVIASKTNEMDLVTQVDKENEATIRRMVLEEHPDHAFLGEELGAKPADVETDAPTVRWIIDPVDGTVNFAHGVPIWCVSIGVEIDGAIECGVIYNPNLNELFTAVRGKGAWLNDTPIHVSKQVNPRQALFVTGFPYNVDENPDRVIEHFVSFLSRGFLVRRLGSAALDLAYVACGRFDGFWEAGLSPWDSAAGQLMVREAGGRVTHYDGSDYDIYRKSIIATNRIQHDMILEIISETYAKLNDTGA